MNFYPKKIGKYWPKPAFLRSRDRGASTRIKISKFGAILTHFIKHFTFFPIFDSPKVPIFESFLKKIIIFWKNQAPGPIANERSQNSASKSLLNSSGDLNATLFMSVQSSKFHVFLLFFLFFHVIPQTSVSDLHDLVNNHHRKDGKGHLCLFYTLFTYNY